MTSFQRKVYEIVRKIPEGRTMTYKQVAKLVGHPRSYRAVGNVLNKNPDPRIIPCHRVIRLGGGIGGYKYGIKRKIALLKKEGIIIKNGKIASRSTK